MRNKNENIHSKSKCIGKIVAIFNDVVSMEFKAPGNILCFQISLHENPISNEIHVWGITAHLELHKCKCLIIH